MSQTCPECVASVPADRPARARSRRRAGLAAALTVVPGLGHAYAGAFGRAFLGFFVGAPVLIALTATGTVAPLGALGLLALYAFDAYRVVRERNGEWTARRSADLRAAMVALVVALASVGIAREAGMHVRPGMALPVFMVIFGVALAWPAGEKTRRVVSVPTTPPVVPPPPERVPGLRVLVPGEVQDRRASRSELAAHFAAHQLHR